jgi:general secretion pathway protein B
MSYILEALRKADAERERGAVPDLHSQLLPDAPPGDETQERRSPRWLWPVVVAALVLGGVWAGSWLGSNAAPEATVPPALTPSAPLAAASTPPVPAMAPVAAADAVAASAAAPASVAPPTPAPAPVQTPAKASATATASASATSSAPAEAARAGPAPTVARAADKGLLAPIRPVPKAKPVPQSGPQAQARDAAAAKAPTRTEEKALAKADAQAPPPRLPRLNELPEELRQQMPALAIGGSVYSPQAEKRMIILNGQVFLEGAVLAPELKLEQIRPKSAVLSIRGQRFELPL